MGDIHTGSLIPVHALAPHMNSFSSLLHNLVIAARDIPLKNKMKDILEDFISVVALFA